MDFLYFFCLDSWLHQSSGEGSHKVDWTRKMLNFIANKSHSVVNFLDKKSMFHLFSGSSLILVNLNDCEDYSIFSLIYGGVSLFVGFFFLVYQFRLIFSFLICSILSARSDPLVFLDFVFWKELGRRFRYFSFRSFFRDAVHSVHTFGSLIKLDGSLHIIQPLSALGNKFVTQSFLEKCI